MLRANLPNGCGYRAVSISADEECALSALSTHQALSRVPYPLDHGPTLESRPHAIDIEIKAYALESCSHVLNFY